MKHWKILETTARVYVVPLATSSVRYVPCKTMIDCSVLLFSTRISMDI